MEKRETTVNVREVTINETRSVKDLYLVGMKTTDRDLDGRCPRKARSLRVENSLLKRVWESADGKPFAI